MFLRRLLLVAALWAVPQSALAHGASGASGEALPRNAPAVTKDGEAAQASMEAIEGDPKKLTFASKAIAKARKALGRAHGAKLSNDVEGARLLSLVALAWSKAAEASVKAADTLNAADALSATRADLTQKLSRAKMILAEHDARRLVLVAAVSDAEKLATGRKKAKPAPAAKTQPKAPPAPKPAPAPKKPVPTQPAKPAGKAP